MTTVRYILLFALTFVLYAHIVSAGSFQRALATLDCFRTTEKRCHKRFTDSLDDNLKWSFDRTSRADTRFYYFAPGETKSPQRMDTCGGKLKDKSAFNSTLPVLFVFPGFVSGICHMAVYRRLLHEIAKCKCYNFIHIEWTWGNSFDLRTALENIKIVAKQAAIIIRYLKAEFKLSHKSFILFGHSLGGHGCGFIGQEERVGQIHGSDPAGVAYTEHTPLDERLDPSDADCVQVFHCNAGQCLPWYFGVNFTCGHMDIYYNDGKKQVSCYKTLFYSIIKGDWIYALITTLYAACQHLQCIEYYSMAMLPQECIPIARECPNYKDFKKKKCDDCGLDGSKCVFPGPYGCDCAKRQNGTRRYYVKTTPCCDYCEKTDKVKNKIDRATCPAIPKYEKPKTSIWKKLKTYKWKKIYRFYRLLSFFTK